MAAASGTVRALENYYRRQIDEIEKARAPQRRNQRPELEVQKSVMAWLKANGFSCNVVESKAVFSAKANRYISGQTVAGFTDVVGAAPNGIAVFIELKSPGRRSTLKPHQRLFLLDKIQLGAFACVVDSVELLERLWREFEVKCRMDRQFAINFLLRHLPEIREPDSGPLFD